MKIDKEIIITMLPITLSIISFIYTRKVDKREEKRYRKTIKDKLRYQALLISKEFSYILNRYGFEYDIIEYWNKGNNKYTKVNGINKVDIKKLPSILNMQDEQISKEYLNIYDYEEIIKEFTKDEIDYIDKAFQLKHSIEKLKVKITPKYKTLNSGNKFVDMDDPEVKEYINLFNSIRLSYQVLFYMICDKDSEYFGNIFRKIDKLSIIQNETLNTTLTHDYEYIKNNFLNHDKHLENIESRMKEYDN